MRVERGAANTSWWTILLWGLLASLGLLPACSTTTIRIVAEPAQATVSVGGTLDITAVVTGTSDPNDKSVFWSVCDGDGNNCVLSGNDTLGTIVVAGRDSSGNVIGRYTAPSSQPLPPSCLQELDGCSVVVKGELVNSGTACFARIKIGGTANPTITSLSPSSATAGDPAFTLTVDGTGFVTSSVTRWDGSNRSTNFISATQLTADIPASDIATAGTASVTVLNPPPGGTSNAVPFTINPCILGVLERTSLTSAGAQGNGVSISASLSGDGRFVTFDSAASNLVAGDTNGVVDVFLRDTCRGVTTGCTPSTVLISVGVGGAQANGESFDPEISADGRFVAFTSLASNLVSGDTNGVSDAFVRDTCLGATGCTPSTFRVSVSSSGAQANDFNDDPEPSGDGRFISFTSFASNLVASDTNGEPDIFVRDTCFGVTNCTPSTVRISVSGAGTEADGPSDDSSITPDGRFVVFQSDATNLVTSDTNFSTDAFLRDRDTDNDGIFDESGAVATVRLSVSSSGAEANSFSDDPEISADGRFVTFTSFADNLVSGDTNFATDVFVHDRDADQDGIFDESGAITTLRVSVSSTGAEADSYSFSGKISADGRVVSFDSLATNLVSGDTNSVSDVFAHDRDADGDSIFDETGAIATVRLSVTSSGVQGDGISTDPQLSADGRLVAFASEASNLVTGDTNAVEDVFVAQICF